MEIRTKWKEVIQTKQIPIILFCVLIFLPFGFADEKQKLNDQEDKESYSLGYRFGQNLKSQGLSINLEVYTSGVKDGLGGVKPRLGQEEINKIISEIQARTMAARQKELKEMGEKNMALGKAFMEENGKKEGVITLPSGLQYKILHEGPGKMPKATDEVMVHYKGTFIDGKEFDNSYTRGTPLIFHADKIIPGWKEVLPLMKEGSKWQLFIPPQLGYGEQGAGPIPPNSTLIFDVELIAIK